ncbi:unnamed protein product [Kluyveromyces dobzhanskii CBS 2104]|uniref:WGS project CCBQ000000000 data, contig 00014 n=1 Tax=Kluyveromyces dobzhanskii CBS 2104 TaxID=1427455 RepID=A0A0A8L6M6_9SACH|nr:unnamed protein product [Kluyveromyces dobzhanskii CBS 2104]
MGVPGRKRKSQKVARQGHRSQVPGNVTSQQFGQGRKNSSGVARVQATNVGSILHDESDVISFRHSLTNEFMLTSRLIDMLTTQPIPMDKIHAPEIFADGALEVLTDHLQKQKTLVSELRLELESKTSAVAVPDDATAFYKRGIEQLADKLYDADAVKRVEKEYSDKFKIVVRPGTVVIHKNKFSHLVPERTHAPSDYWQRHKKILAERQEQERNAREQEEERKRQEQMALSVDPIAADLAVPSKPDEVEQEQLPVADPNDPNILDNVFGEEPFQNGFDDGFGDLDTAFF